MSDPIVIVAYDPSWPERFEVERGRLLEVFDPACSRIEHVGSTAIPGLAAKAIIDMMLGATSLAEVERRIPELEALGWEYVPRHEAAIPERRFFARPVPRPRTHHLHAVELGSGFWKQHLRFRDHLRAHAADAAVYVALKRELAERYRDDRPAYTEAKTEFIESILARSR